MKWNQSGAKILEYLHSTLETAMSDRGGLGLIEEIHLPVLVPDANSKFLIRARDGIPTAILAVASEASPSSVAAAATNAQMAKGVLGSVLGDCVLQPWLVRESEGISYSVTPYCQPFASSGMWSRFERWRIRDPALYWLRCAVEHTRSSLDSDECRDLFIEPLGALARNDAVPRYIQSKAEECSKRIEWGDWVPKSVLAHNDLWIGNMLRSPPKHTYPFVVIDWAGARVRGHAIYDLMRLVRSLSLSRYMIRDEISYHCALLSCGKDQAIGYLLASFGYFSMNLGDWPEARFLATAVREVEVFSQCVGMSDSLL